MAHCMTMRKSNLGSIVSCLTSCPFIILNSVMMNWNVFKEIHSQLFLGVKGENKTAAIQIIASERSM
jgi:hypothetical protein